MDYHFAVHRPARPSSLFASAKSAIDSIRLNHVTREIQDGRGGWLKTRTPGSERIARIANLFFRLARNPVRVWEKSADWQQREMDNFNLLHRDEFRARGAGRRGVRLDDIAGVNLCEELELGRLTDAMLDAAARELARAHALTMPRDNGLGGDLTLPSPPWSHGDARLANFLFDPTANRARLIDFEVRHLPTLTAEQRHADDLLVFLQDLMGRLPDERWLPAALRFLHAYGRCAPIAALKNRLAVPRFGFPRLWWAIRTRYTPRAKLVQRTQALRENLA